MLLPVGHEENTVKRWPWVTLGIIGACLVIDLIDVPKDAWALVPAAFSLLKVLTSMFVHIDGWHLGFNLFFLYLAGPSMEDIWGRPYFAALYFLSGLAGALTVTFFYPESTIPRLGASGAISGVMGAFAVRHRKARIRFFYFFGPGFTGLAGTFSAPAGWMLGLWLFREVFGALAVYSGLAPGEVSHWAHVGGFLFGMAVAMGISAFGLESGYLHKKILAKDVLIDNATIEQAYEAQEQNRPQEAWDLVLEELRRHPNNRAAAILLWDLGVELNRSEQAWRPMLRCIHEELREEQGELALGHWDAVRARLPEVRPGLVLRQQLAELLLVQGRCAEVAELLAGVVDEADALPPTDQLRLARLAAQVDAAAARKILGIALANPQASPELHAELKAIQHQLTVMDFAAKPSPTLSSSPPR